MRFQLIDAAKKAFPVQRLCKVLGVSESGYFAWRSRPASRRQHEDMVVLAHVRSASRCRTGPTAALGWSTRCATRACRSAVAARPG